MAFQEVTDMAEYISTKVNLIKSKKPACLCKDCSNINLDDLEVIENAEDSETNYDDDFSDEDKDSDSD